VDSTTCGNAILTAWLVQDLHACHWPNKPVHDLTRQGLATDLPGLAYLRQLGNPLSGQTKYFNFSFIHFDTSIMHVTVACLSQNAVTPVAVIGENSQEGGGEED